MTTIDRRRVPVGALVAEGGEGKVHEVVGRPGVLYKAYRRPVSVTRLTPLLEWRRQLDAERPDLGRRVAAGAAWPTEIVADGHLASGLLLPRAPERFSVRHRDGVSHLATLSYLTADPRQRAAAYGLRLPAPVSIDRIALVYALARLLAAFDDGPSTLAHGDLSTKNVLWSLRDRPEVYVIDCDGSRLFDAAGRPFLADRRPHVATPNWDDPAAAGGVEPGVRSDRYSLALVFLRVVGAAHYPIQARQKRGEELVIDVEIPPWGRRGQRLHRSSPVWDLCSRGLGVRSAADRPTAAEWSEVLEGTLRELSARHLVEAVRAAQGDAACELSPLPVPGPDVPAPPAREVTVRGKAAEVRPESFRATAPAFPIRPADTLGGGWRPPGAQGTPLVVHTGGGSSGGQIRDQVRRQARAAAQWWWLLHQRTARTLRTPGRRGQGVRSVLACAVTDFVTACFGLFLVAMVVSPFLGI